MSKNAEDKGNSRTSVCTEQMMSLQYFVLVTYVSVSYFKGKSTTSGRQ